jgi:hypothetical protein
VRYKLDLEGVQKDRWDKGGTVRRAVDYIFSYEMETKIINWEQDLLYITEQYQQSKRVEFVIVKGCHIHFREVAAVISRTRLHRHQGREEK